MRACQNVFIGREKGEHIVQMQALFQVWAWVSGFCDSNLPVAVIIPGLSIVQDAHGWPSISEQNHFVAVPCFTSVCVMHILTFSLPSGS